MPKYTVSDLRKLLSEGRIEPTLWMIHFSNVLDTKVPTCSDCADFDLCELRKENSEINPIDCFIDRKGETELVTDTFDSCDEEDLDESEQYKRSLWK